MSGDVLAGRRPVLELLRAGQAAQRILIADGLAPSSVLGQIRKRAEGLGVEVRVVARAEVDRLAGDHNHQGVVALVGGYRYVSLQDLLARRPDALLFLDGVMDPHNLGSLLRSADGAGIDGVVIRTRRAVAVTGSVRRIAAGAAEVVAVARVPNIGQALDRARREGMWAVGFDAGGSQDVWGSKLLEPPVALVLGAEDSGISRVVKDHCDELVRIPSAGRLGSLNVAVAGALAMFEVSRRRHQAAADEHFGGEGST